jgi:hypothetical protein
MTKKRLSLWIPLTIASIFLSGLAIAQDNVGIGTTTPHPNSILDISSVDRGLMIPRLNTLQRFGMANPPTTTLPNTADGLLVYDTDIEKFCYWNDDLVDWVCFGEGSNGATGPTVLLDPLVLMELLDLPVLLDLLVLTELRVLLDLPALLGLLGQTVLMD